jgi:hypothetical protein
MLALWIVWSVLTLCVIGLALVRKFAAYHEDDMVHLTEGEQREIPRQVAIARRLEKFDQWGKTLTVVDLVFGVALVGFMLYNAWEQSQVFK